MDSKDKTQRRVYVLPNDLVERIVAYQQELGLASEVEAVRRLLDDSLKYRDDFVSLTGRFISVLKDLRSVREAARDILTDHPLVKSISFDGDAVRFEMTTGYTVIALSSGVATVLNKNGNVVVFGSKGIPEWASEHHRVQSEASANSKSETDDIPF